MMWEGIDKRKFPRAAYKCLIRVSKEGSEEAIETFTENVGSGGICVVLNKDYGLFEKVSLEILLEEGRELLVCEGKIVWVVKKHPMIPSEATKYDTGIEFVGMAEEDAERVSQLIQDLSETEA